MLSVGVYPDVGLKQARERSDEARKQLAAGIDPGEARKAEKATASGADSFEAVAREWWERNRPKWAEGTAKNAINRLEKDIFPHIGARTIGEVKAPELLAALRRIEARGAIELSHYARQCCGKVFRYAIATGRAERDPAADLRGALAPLVVKHRATLTDPREVGALLQPNSTFKRSFAFAQPA